MDGVPAAYQPGAESVGGILKSCARAGSGLLPSL
jgi:hypothetical protein